MDESLWMSRPGRHRRFDGHALLPVQGRAVHGGRHHGPAGLRPALGVGQPRTAVTSETVAGQFYGLLNSPAQIDAARELAKAKGGDVPDIGRLSAG
jgi:hypothetical protein